MFDISDLDFLTKVGQTISQIPLGNGMYATKVEVSHEDGDPVGAFHFRQDGWQFVPEHS